MPSPHSRLIRRGALVLQLLLLGTAGAELADRGKPMHIEADRLRFDELKQLRVITGNVLITKGSIVIRGARVEMREDPAGHQFAKITGEAGRRAFFRQKREGIDEFIEGEGETIDYDGQADVVKFSGRAEMRRLRGATLYDQINGNLITYDNRTEVFNVDGASAGGGGSGRIRIMLTPAPDGTRGTAVTPAAPSSAPLLRSSPTLRREPG